MELKTKIGNIKLDHPIMNAAGTCKTLEDVRKLAKSNVAAVVVGSITKDPRELPTGETFFMDPGGVFSLNSRNLFNGGLPYYEGKGILRQMVQICYDAGKPMIVSIAGFSPEENEDLALFVADCEADAVELNAGCPNIANKTIVSYDPQTLDEHLVTMETGLLGIGGQHLPIILKLSPIPPSLRQAVAEKISNSLRIVAVVTSNTLPDGFAWHPEYRNRTAITPNNGFAGMAGRALKPLSLGLMGKLRELLPPHIDMIGAGGIASGQDVKDYRQQGAVAVQVATEYMAHGEDPNVFYRILAEYATLLEAETPVAS